MKLEVYFENYFNERMKFFDMLQEHLKKFPTRNTSIEKNSVVHSTSAKGIKENNRDVERVSYINFFKFLTSIK